jgi:hypothetical protein
MRAVLLLTILAPLLLPIGAQAKPHMHYEIFINHPNMNDVRPEDRLKASCDLAKAITARTNKRHDPVLSLDLALLRLHTCGKSN